MTYQEWKDKIDKINKTDPFGYYNEKYIFRHWQKDHDQLTEQLNKANEMILRISNYLKKEYNTGLEIEQYIKSKIALEINQYFESIKSEVK